MSVYQAVAGQQLRVPLRLDVEDTGLDLTDFTILAVEAGATVTDPTVSLALILVEPDDEAVPGYYELAITPSEQGLTWLSLVYEDHTFVVEAQVSHEALDLLGAVRAGIVGTYVITVQNGVGAPVYGAVVSVYTSTGTGLVARGTTNASGEASFSLPVGTYYVRVAITGYDCSSVNPTEITVVADDNVGPVLTELVPEASSAGEMTCVKGMYFHATETEVLFEDEWVTAASVSADGTVALVEIPGDASGTTEVRVRKPDPDDPGEYLLSNVLYMVVS